MTESSAAPRIGPYELLKRIGKGAMASVYLARKEGAEGFSRAYAVKVMHPNLSEDPEMVDMLMDEARMVSRLSHPNVVSTVDIGTDQGHYYLVMEYVEGVALDRLLRARAARSPAMLVSVAIDALEGLAAAHALTDDEGQPLELVHRDVTPGNIIVSCDGRALIADFGVAKARARLTKTMPGLVKGKAGYVAPEVALGKKIDGRADVFSMGVLLWNVLTGESLYDTDDLAKSIRELVQKEVPPPSTVGLKPPPIFDQPILSALHREPHERHQSARDMAEALRDALTMHGGEPSEREIGDWVYQSFRGIIDERRRLGSPDAPLPEPSSAPRGAYEIGPGLFPDEPGADEDAPTMIADIDIDVALEGLSVSGAGPAGGAPYLGSAEVSATQVLSGGAVPGGYVDPYAPRTTPTLPPSSLDAELEAELAKERRQGRVLLSFAILLFVFALGAAGLIGYGAYKRSQTQRPQMRALELAE